MHYVLLDVDCNLRENCVVLTYVRILTECKNKTSKIVGTDIEALDTYQVRNCSVTANYSSTRTWWDIETKKHFGTIRANK